MSRTPQSTYRLQITADFDLFEAARRLPYLHALGADWVYLSPILVAEPGSTHGYDVVSHATVDPARGGPEGLAALSAEARRLGLGVLVDIVPNHMGVATPAVNAWWWDLLKHGRSSAYADYFDVDWDFGGGRLRIPVVGDGDEGSIRVEDGEVRYHEHRFPLAPGTSTHDEQHYELVSWRAADSELNYRRFFAVNTLAAIRVEDREVFDASHVEIRRWFDEGLVDGLRVDHPDGLRDPGGYLEDLATLTGGAYVLVEKILALRDASSLGSSGTARGEDLPRFWATAGTTGYDALGLVDRLLTDPAGQAPLDALETRLRGAEVDWHAMIRGTKRMIADGILHSEVRRIVRELPAEIREAQDVTDLEDAVAELLACFPVYRSYLPEERSALDDAFEAARRSRPDLTGVLEVLEPVLGDAEADAALRFQQTSGMVMAKGVEDTAFYRYSRLTSLNEVGGEPSEFSLSLEEWHARAAERQESWPTAMTALSTHDTKRGEDVRARITVLSEIPSEWDAALTRLLELAPAPDPGFASLLWQAVLGSWPASRERLHGYAEKAMREAGDRTTWTAPDADYEAAVHGLVDAAFDDAEVRRVLDGLLERVVGPGWVNSLSAKLLAIAMPGVPDVYQGSELWEQSLVDPDNRRFVDLDAREELLAGLDEWAPAASVALDDLGVDKLLVTTRALRLRRERPELFTSYTPVAASGEATDHVVAFDRGGAVAVATRLPVGLAARGGWGDTTLALSQGRWRDVISDRIVSGDVADVLDTLPVALLVKED
ncbi:malto-oligosyltrehalose synthase [Nocardioides sp. cx-173]|uniref:malto-oligosyltrehalose synthase n=1 Tax=Nocardioides sp. cx-173 TaxID=2898796 RepID=UPI001E2D90AA|nr:malto-oligosyltrehalose synthase [Nocardioides sp. cx-173]MCD4526781.1 malto-oligosyltrehalose synthase [Nocardioides sp. cx-173]UGB43887.1 malto-oligosyltrehalose synthase [Nocardioides sp. cx-173]